MSQVLTRDQPENRYTHPVTMCCGFKGRQTPKGPIVRKISEAGWLLFLDGIKREGELGSTKQKYTCKCAMLQIKQTNKNTWLPTTSSPPSAPEGHNTCPACLLYEHQHQSSGFKRRRGFTLGTGICPRQSGIFGLRRLGDTKSVSIPSLKVSTTPDLKVNLKHTVTG